MTSLTRGAKGDSLDDAVRQRKTGSFWFEIFRFFHLNSKCFHCFWNLIQAFLTFSFLKWLQIYKKVIFEDVFLVNIHLKVCEKFSQSKVLQIHEKLAKLNWKSFRKCVQIFRVTIFQLNFVYLKIIKMQSKTWSTFLVDFPFCYWIFIVFLIELHCVFSELVQFL